MLQKGESKKENDSIFQNLHSTLTKMKGQQLIIHRIT